MAARRVRSTLVGLGLVMGCGLLLAAPSQAARKGVAVTEGKLTQLALTAGCVSETGVGGACTDDKALLHPEGAAVSPDGRHVYVASRDSDAISVFTRNQATGALTQLAGTDGCVSDSGTGGQCADGKALLSAFSPAVSPDGKHVYVTAAGSDAVAAFSRNPATGKLTQLSGTDGCVSETGTGGLGADGKALVGPIGILVSPDGEHVDGTLSTSDAVAAFDRNPATGVLTQLSGTDGCVSETGTGGLCVNGNALDTPQHLTISPGGEHLYSTNALSSSVTAFSRNASTGVLTQLAGTAGCVSEDGTGGLCTNVRALFQPVGDLAESRRCIRLCSRAGLQRRRDLQPELRDGRAHPSGDDGRVRQRRRNADVRQWERARRRVRCAAEPRRALRRTRRPREPMRSRPSAETPRPEP